jgi:hypothetical protein
MLKGTGTSQGYSSTGCAREEVPAHSVIFARKKCEKKKKQKRLNKKNKLNQPQKSLPLSTSLSREQRDDRRIGMKGG